MYPTKFSKSLSRILYVLFLLTVLLTACNTATTEPAAIATTLPAATATSAAPTQTPVVSEGHAITLTVNGVAQSYTLQEVKAVDSNDSMWGAMSRYTLLTLNGYQVGEHPILPQIFVFPVDELAATNPTAGKIIFDLQSLLESRQAGEKMPFLPLDGNVQTLHAQVKYLDFKNGSGARYLTQYNSGLVMINNKQLIYTYQGLTSDGKYYVAAVLPVTHPELPDTQQAYGQTVEELKGFPEYMTQTAAWLDQQAPNSFTPDLAKLDGMVQSIAVK